MPANSLYSVYFFSYICVMTLHKNLKTDGIHYNTWQPISRLHW